MSVAIPDYVEPFEGWRVWRASKDGSQLRLRSVVQETVWPPRAELAAECLRRRILPRVRGRRRHGAPAEVCACGIYATTLDRLGSYLHARGDGRAHYVFGRVLLWGTVIECEQGWRGARAYPAEIIVPAPPRASAPAIMAPWGPAGASGEEIADALSCYAVPIVVLPHTPAEALDVVALEHGCDNRIGSMR
jgi:hypothetical protein